MRFVRGAGRCVVGIIVAVCEPTVLALLVGPVGLADVRSGARFYLILQIGVFSA